MNVKRNPEAVAALVAAVAAGATMHDAAELLGLAPCTVSAWVRESPELAGQVAAARVRSRPPREKRPAYGKRPSDLARVDAMASTAPAVEPPRMPTAPPAPPSEPAPIEAPPARAAKAPAPVEAPPATSRKRDTRPTVRQDELEIAILAASRAAFGEARIGRHGERPFPKLPLPADWATLRRAFFLDVRSDVERYGLALQLIGEAREWLDHSHAGGMNRSTAQPAGHVGATSGDGT